MDRVYGWFANFYEWRRPEINELQRVLSVEFREQQIAKNPVIHRVTGFSYWRRGSESNRRTRLCRGLYFFKIQAFLAKTCVVGHSK